MSRVATTNYLADSDTQFAWATDDNDPFDRELDISYVARALERHTHAAGRGVQIPSDGIVDDAITQAKIAAGAVGTAEIADDAITAAKIALNAVGASEIVAGAVGTDEIADDAVNAAKIAAGAVGLSELAAGVVVAQLGYTPVNKAGDIMTGDLQLTNRLTAHGDGVSPGEILLYDEVPNTFWLLSNLGGDLRILRSSLGAGLVLGDDGTLSWFGDDVLTVDDEGTVFAAAAHAHDTTYLKLAQGASKQTITFTSGSIEVGQGLTGGLNGIRVAGDFAATGLKTRISTGKNEESGIFHALESPVPYFEEFGHGQLEQGVATVSLPKDFANHVVTEEYQVYVTPEGPALLYVEERRTDGFIVRGAWGARSIRFAWRVVARQYDHRQIERVIA